MDLSEAIIARHSVRVYNDKPLEPAVVAELQATIDDINRDAGLHIQMCLDEPEAFHSFLSKMRHFSNVKHYIAMIGKDLPEMEEKIGYYGEKIVLHAMELGLGTCWVAASYSKGKCISKVGPGEKRYALLAFGYSDEVVQPHKSKSIEELSTVSGPMPDWFRRGMEAAQMAPTGFNKQRFHITLDGDKVQATAPHAMGGLIDLGIVKYHFEIGAKGGNWHWAE